LLKLSVALQQELLVGLKAAAAAAAAVFAAD